MFRTKIKIILPLLLLLVGVAVTFTGCQRDDICPEATPVTPLITIFFFDAEEPDLPKTVPSLRVRSVDFDTIVFPRENTNEITIPLRTDRDVTVYEFIRNAPIITEDGEGEPGENTNSDIVEFIYSREENYVNRACSFIVNYIDIRPIPREDDNPWITRINSIIVEGENLENETDTYFAIYH